jgi:hypothetical protein
MTYFHIKTPNLGIFWKALEVENVGIFYDHLEYVTAIWYIFIMAIWYSLWSFGIYFPFWFVLTMATLPTTRLTSVFFSFKNPFFGCPLSGQ